MRPYTIRPIHSADLAAVLRIQAACYPPPMQEPEGVVLSRMAAAGATCAVAEDDAGVCAYLFAYPNRLGAVTALDGDFHVAVDADTLYLHDLAVAPRAHGRGLARALVRHLLAQARELGLAASALVSVQDSAAFWTALGYRPARAADPAALASYPVAAHYMVRALTEPGAPSPSC